MCSKQNSRFKSKRVQHDYRNKSKELTKHIPCRSKCKFGGITINVDVRGKNVMYVKKIIFEILLHVVVKMENM